MRQNRPVVYSGGVGAKMRPSRPKREPVKRAVYHLRGGPLADMRVRLELNGDGCTLPITVRGQCGQYRLLCAGNVLEWVPQ